MNSQQVKKHFEDYYKNVGYNKSDLIKYLKNFDNDGYNESYDESFLTKQVGNVLIIVGPCTLDFYLAKTI